MNEWHVFKGKTNIDDLLNDYPEWRRFDGEVVTSIPEDNLLEQWPERELKRAVNYYLEDPLQIDIINVAIRLRRPLLVTGKPGSGKSSLAYAIAYNLQLDRVLQWPISSKSTVKDALYMYDAIARLEDANISQTLFRNPKKPPIEQYIRLGPLGTAFLPQKKPRVLLIDEIDKSDIDIPGDLLNIFEEGEFQIEELLRINATNVKVKTYKSETEVIIPDGIIKCSSFPIIIMTSNGERDFPPQFLRRCIRLDIKPPDLTKMQGIVENHFPNNKNEINRLIDSFIEKKDELASDQLLNAIFLRTQSIFDLENREDLLNVILKSLNN